MSHHAFAAVLLALGSLIASPAAAADHTLTLDARLAQPVMQEGAAQKNYLRVALGGCRPEPNANRTPVNVAFVIDRSGSMNGDRIAQAREAAIMAVSRLGPDDIASVIVFDTRADVLVPAQKVTNPDYFIDQIRRIALGGSTAIHDGVLKGRGELVTYMDPRRLNRIVLLSDGQANVGPSRVDDFIRLGQALLRERISVSTIGLGLGYNEDLMLQLALASDGNHAFARDPSDLITIFNREFNDVLASCAQTVSIDIDLKPGVRAVRALSRDGTIAANKAQFRMNQVYAATEHYVLLEVEFDKDQAVAGGEHDLGVVKVAYTDARSGEAQTLDTAIRGRFSASADEVRAGADTKVGEAVVEQVARARAREAVTLRDQGRYDEARTLLQQNATEINAFAASVPNAPAQLLELGNQYRALGTATVTPAPPSSRATSASSCASSKTAAPAPARDIDTAGSDPAGSDPSSHRHYGLKTNPGPMATSAGMGCRSENSSGLLFMTLRMCLGSMCLLTSNTAFSTPSRCSVSCALHSARIVVRRDAAVHLLDVVLHGGLGDVELQAGNPARADRGRLLGIVAHPLVGLRHAGEEFLDGLAVLLHPGPQGDVKAEVGDDIAAADHLDRARHVLHADHRHRVPARIGVHALGEQRDVHFRRRRVDERDVGGASPAFSSRARI